MTMVAPAPPSSPLGRLRWALADGWTVTRRDIIHWIRQPVALIVNLAFSVMLVLVFGYLFGGAMSVPGGGNYREFLLPGMLVLMMFFSLESTIMAITEDKSKGVTDRFRSMPMSPSAVVLGRATADMLMSVITLVALVACGLAVDWKINRGIGLALAAFGLMLLLRFALLWLGIYLGLMLPNPESVAAVQILVWPLGFLTSVYAPPETMPNWLGTIAEWNPLSSTVSAVRELFGNPGIGGDSWIAQHSILMAVLWPVLITVVFFPLAVRRYQRLSR
ncbi:ABC-type multidrug transport system permease subunit [Herbihabitans rhizosphaerae]|uniref:Transport permease protein n=1 Tax=Herbihabitans rhizosphaerae TaxID=1872711 RepID=A0A4Q7KCM9_9PSEU|nr:ABC transporter permease [Herbihabitans rhizosphaerae]RZS31249.1 ABC-type multidrug transport system permease subunit [Herbihabitans rhizosphaerae]